MGWVRVGVPIPASTFSWRVGARARGRPTAAPARLPHQSPPCSPAGLPTSRAQGSPEPIYGPLFLPRKFKIAVTGGCPFFHVFHHPLWEGCARQGWQGSSRLAPPGCMAHCTCLPACLPAGAMHARSPNLHPPAAGDVSIILRYLSVAPALPSWRAGCVVETKNLRPAHPLTHPEHACMHARRAPCKRPRSRQAPALGPPLAACPLIPACLTPAPPPLSLALQCRATTAWTCSPTIWGWWWC